MSNIAESPHRSLFEGLQNLHTSYGTLVRKISDLEDEQLIQVYFYLEEIGSLNWKAKCACLWEAFQRLKERKENYTQKDVANLGKEFNLAQSTVYQYVQVWDTFFADSNILEWKITEYNFFRMALGDPNPVEALQHAEEERVVNNNYTLKDFKRDIIKRKREQKVEEAILPEVESEDKRVILGNALEILPNLESKLVDCIITQPPILEPELHEKWIFETLRVLKEDGHIFIICNHENRYPILKFMNMVYFIRYLSWVKKYTENAPFRGVIPLHKAIFWGTKSELISIPRGSDPIEDVIHIEGEHRYGHPDEMPEKLAKRLIELGSDIGDTILDPFAGSGTVLSVAKNLGRNYLGIEYTEKYHKLILSRLSERNKNKE